MTYHWLIFSALILLAMLAQPFFVEKRGYRYRRKKYIMTAAEFNLFLKLQHVFGDEYYIFPQVHLSSLFDEKVKGQSFRAAFNHINGKSVDFVLVNKKTLVTVCAIECDDFTHNRKDRIARDIDVNDIFKAADVPLVRLQNSLNKNSQKIQKEIKKVLDN